MFLSFSSPYNLFFQSALVFCCAFCESLLERCIFHNFSPSGVRKLRLEVNTKRQRQEGSENFIQMSAVLVSLYLSRGSNVGSFPVGPVFSFPRRELHRNINLQLCKLKSATATRFLEERRDFARFCIFRASSFWPSVGNAGSNRGWIGETLGWGRGWVGSVRVNSPERRHIFELCRSR